MKKKIPQRLCLGCQQLFDKRDLVRIVKNEKGTLSIDATGKKAGRGAYVCRNKECIEKAFKAHRLERSLKTNIDAALCEKLKESIF